MGASARKTMRSLHGLGHIYANPKEQLRVLGNLFDEEKWPCFQDKVEAATGTRTLHSLAPAVMQLNLGKMCNQRCGHCHVDAGPDRKEIMTRATMRECLSALDQASSFEVVDLTGGAPEMNPDFRWLVEEVRARGKRVIVRCNLTIILAHPKYKDLPDFYRHNQVEVVCSLPHYSAMRTDAQRGQGVFAQSIEALKMLNDVGYGDENTSLTLNVVHNPSGAFLPGDQQNLEKEFKEQLMRRFGIRFNQLFSITNMPISRFLDYLWQSNNLTRYMQELVQAFNSSTLPHLMCRNTLSVGWDGDLYDCDFNQMLALKLNSGAPSHIRDFSLEKLTGRTIQTHAHCYGCTAGAGSSCGGEIADAT